MNPIYRNYIVGLIALMLSGPLVVIAFMSSTVAKYPFSQPFILVTGLLLGLVGTLIFLYTGSDA